jgi:hypothetical protein
VEAWSLLCGAQGIEVCQGRLYWAATSATTTTGAPISRWTGTARPPKHGLYSKYRAVLGDLDGLTDPGVEEELAYVRILLHKLQDTWDLEDTAKSPDLLDSMCKLVDQIRKLVETLKKPLPMVTALTVSVQETGILETIAEVILDLGGDDFAAAFATELHRRAYGNASDQKAGARKP